MKGYILEKIMHTTPYKQSISKLYKEPPTVKLEKEKNKLLSVMRLAESRQQLIRKLIISQKAKNK